ALFPHDTATPETSTLSLHDALPIWICSSDAAFSASPQHQSRCTFASYVYSPWSLGRRVRSARCDSKTLSSGATSSGASSCMSARSEEHTSELQSRENLVCRLLLEKK